MKFDNDLDTPEQESHKIKQKVKSFMRDVLFYTASQYSLSIVILNKANLFVELNSYKAIQSALQLQKIRRQIKSQNNSYNLFAHLPF